MRWWLFLVACAHADPHQLYLRGRAHYHARQYQLAIADFDHAYKISREPALLFDLAQAQRKNRAPDRALPLYRAYLRAQPRAANRVEVKLRIAQLRRQTKIN